MPADPNAFSRTFSTWGDVLRNYSNRLAQQPARQAPPNFWREILAKDAQLNRQYEAARNLMPQFSAGNIADLGRYVQSANRANQRSSGLTDQQIGAAMAPFTGQLSGQLGQARQRWADMASSQAAAARGELGDELSRWNRFKTTSIDSLRDALGRQLSDSYARTAGLLQRNYGEETELNRDYGNIRDQLSKIRQNRAINSLLAATAPGMGSVMSDYTRRAAMRDAEEAAAADAEVINRLQRDSLLRRMSGELGLTDRQAALERADLQNLAQMYLGQGDNYYQQMAALLGMDDARRRQIIDNIIGSGALSDIGYVTGVQGAMLGRPQALLQADTQSMLAPIQARNMALAAELGMVPRAAEALHAANWLAVGTPYNLGGYPIYSNPPPPPPPPNNMQRMYWLGYQ